MKKLLEWILVLSVTFGLFSLFKTINLKYQNDVEIRQRESIPMTTLRKTPDNRTIKTFSYENEGEWHTCYILGDDTRYQSISCVRRGQ